MSWRAQLFLLTNVLLRSLRTIKIENRTNDIFEQTQKI